MKRRNFAVPVLALGLAVVLVGPFARSAVADSDDKGDERDYKVVEDLVTVTGPTQFSPNCNGAPQTGVNYPNAAVEPSVSVNPIRRNQVVATYQQDRWSNGGANGLGAKYSRDGGETWTYSAPPFTRCAGGNAANGGDYERGTDPWVSFGPNGEVYFQALAFSDTTGVSAILVSRSDNGGATWGPISTVFKDDSGFQFFNDKNAITADPYKPGYVYNTWDRLDQFGPAPEQFRGPAYLSRSIDGGRTWEPGRPIYDPGDSAQTIGVQIAVLPNGDLVSVFARLLATTNDIAIQRSTDKGVTWSEPISVGPLDVSSIADPLDGAPVRTGDIIPDIAVDPVRGTVHVVWQDNAATGSGQIVLSSSNDGGRSWSAPNVVSENQTTQAFNAMVDADSRGNVTVTYYDFTNDTAASPTLDTDYWATQSRDGGITFSDRTRLTQSFDMRVAPLTGSGYFLGDYAGLAARTQGRRGGEAVLFVTTTKDPSNVNDVQFVALPAPRRFHRPRSVAETRAAAPNAARSAAAASAASAKAATKAKRTTR